MLINKIGVVSSASAISKARMLSSNKINFKGALDSFTSMPEVVFGNFTKEEMDEILKTVQTQDKSYSGWTSDIYRYKNKVIKAPNNREHLSKAQNLKEYYALNAIKGLKPPATPKAQGVIRDKDSYYLVEEFVEGVNPIGKPLSKAHLTDLLSKFLNLDKRGITNCDLNPSNVFLLDGAKTKIIDFGSFNVIMNDGSIVPSDALDPDIFKPDGKIFDKTLLNYRTRFLKTFLTDNDLDLKSQADNPYLKMPSNATNFEFRTLYSHLLNGSEENPLEFFKMYLKTKAQTYHDGLKRFLETLGFNDVALSDCPPDELKRADGVLKQAINYQDLIKQALSNPDDDVVKVELAKLQFRTFLNLHDSLGSNVENSTKLKDAYDELIATLTNAINNASNEKKEYFSQTLADFEAKFKNYSFSDVQVQIPENENLLKALFKNAVSSESVDIPQTIKETIDTQIPKNIDETVSQIQQQAARIIDESVENVSKATVEFSDNTKDTAQNIANAIASNTKISNKKLGALITFGSAAVLLSLLGIGIYKKNKNKAKKQNQINIQTQNMQNPFKDETYDKDKFEYKVNYTKNAPDVFSKFK